MADTGDAERLVVMLEARIRDFERNMAKASKTAGSNFTGMQRDSRRATRQMERDMQRSTSFINRALSKSTAHVGTFAKVFAGGLVAGGVAGIISRVGSVANAIAEVGDESRRAGVHVRAFQELKYVAEQNRIGVDSLTDGLKELNLRADEFIVTGGGAAAEAFQRLGYDADTLKQKLADPSALFTEIIGKLGELDRAAQIRIADEIFGGTGGEKFVQLIEQGRQGIEATIQEARDLGLVMEEDLIERAAEVNRRFNTIAQTVGTSLKGAIVDAASALMEFMNLLEPFERQTRANLEANLSVLREQRALYGVEGSDAYNKSLADEAKIMAQLRNLATNDLRTGLMQLPGNSGGSGVVETEETRRTSTKSIEDQSDAVNELIAGLEFERELLGLSTVDQEKLKALREAGADATEKQKDKIRELIELYHAESEAIKQREEMLKDLEQIAQQAGSAFVDALSDGKLEASELNDILKDVLSSLTKMLLNAAIGQIFGGMTPMSIMPNAKGGAYASSGLSAYSGSIVSKPTIFPFAKGGALGLMGEAGAEAILPLSRGRDGKLGVQAQSSQTNIVIENHGAKVDHKTERAPDGREVQRFIVNTVNSAEGGSLDAAFGRFGGKRRATARG